MNIIRLKHDSNILKRQNNVNIIFPENIYEDKPSKVLLFLHGLGANEETYLENSFLFEASNEYNLVIILPNCDRSFYCNFNPDNMYYDYIEKELFCIVNNFINLNTDDMDKYVAGISMGGYGALKLFLKNNEKFLGCASISGSVDIMKRDIEKRKLNNKISKEWIEMFGDKMDTGNDLFPLLNPDIKNKIYICCGDEDHLKKYNDELSLLLLKNKIPYKYDEGDGEHNKKYFYPHVKKGIQYLIKGE